MSSWRVLVVDGGRTSCRVGLFVDGHLEARRTSPGVPYRRSGSLTPILDALRNAVAPHSGEPLTAAVFGLAAVETSEVALEIRDGLKDFTRAAEWVFCVDAVTQYAGALGSQPGVVIAAGTGAIALSIGPSGKMARSDGWGYILGDEGSGYGIGRAALRGALRSFDGRAPCPELEELVQEAYGPLDRLTESIYRSPSPPTKVAELAPRVAAAAREGNRAAMDIWERAAMRLAETAAAAAGRASSPEDEMTASWTGGLFEAGDLLVQPFRHELAKRLPRARIVAPRADALFGGWLIATTRDSLLEPAIFRFREPNRTGAVGP